MEKLRREEANVHQGRKGQGKQEQQKGIIANLKEMNGTGSANIKKISALGNFDGHRQKDGGKRISLKKKKKVCIKGKRKRVDVKKKGAGL